LTQKGALAGTDAANASLAVHRDDASEKRTPSSFSHRSSRFRASLSTLFLYDLRREKEICARTRVCVRQREREREREGEGEGERVTKTYAEKAKNIEVKREKETNP